MARRGVGAAISGAGKPLKPKRKPKLPVDRARGGKKPAAPVSSALRRGPLEKPDLSKPQREAAARTRRAQGRVRPKLAAPAGRGDAPQTRKADAKRAESHKKTPAYKGAKNAAVVAARKRALKRALEALAAPRQVEAPSALEAAARAVALPAIGAARSVAENAPKVGLATNPMTAPFVAAAKGAEAAGVDVDKELSGTGEAAKALGRLGEFYKEKGVQVSTGAGPSLGPLVAGGGRLPRGAAAIAPRATRVADMPPVFGNFGADVLAFPTTAVSSAYVPAKAALEAAGGDTTAAKEYAKGIQTDDPLYAVGEAVVRGATGDGEGARESLNRAKDLAEEHPFYTALEVGGFAKGASRGVSRTISGGGRAARATGRATGSERLQRAGDRAYEYATPTNRPDAVIPGTQFAQDRRYSRGIVGKRLQVRRDARKSGEAQAIRDEAAASEARAIELRDRAETLGPESPDRAKIMQEADRLDAEVGEANARAALIDPEIAASRRMGAVNRRVDVQREQANEGRIALVEAVDADVQRITTGRRTIKSPKGEEPAALNPIAQAIVKADVEDLRAYRTELEAAYRDLPAEGDKRAANRKVRETLDAAIKAEEKRPGTLKESAERAKDFSAEVDRPLDEQLVDLGIITRERADRAKVIPYAAREGGYVDDTPRLTEAGVRREEVAAKRDAANKDLRRAQREDRSAASQKKDAVRSATSGPKRTPQLSALERRQRAARSEANQARRAQSAQRRRTSRAEGRAEGSTRRAERAWLRTDKEFAGLERELKKTYEAKGKLRSELKQVQRTDPKRAAEIRTEAKTLSLRANALRKQAEDRAKFLVADYDVKAEGAKRREKMAAVKAGEKPKRTTRKRPERESVLRARRRKYAERAKEGNPDKRVADAEAALKRADEAVRAEKQRISGVRPDKADKLRRAIEKRDKAAERLKAERQRVRDVKEEAAKVRRETRNQPSKAAPGLVDAEGRKRSTEAWIEDISKERDAPGSFVGQRPNVAGGGSFFRDSSREPVIPGQARTERATQQGLYDPSVEAMRASAMSRANMIGAAKGFRDAVFEFAQRKGDGEVANFRDRKTADTAAQRITRQTGIRHVAINALPWERNHAASMLAEAGNEPPLAFDMMRTAMLDGLQGNGIGEFVIVPEAFALRTRKHVELLGPGDGAKMAQAFRGAFSRTVLSTSLSPLIGNIVEASFRTAVLHAGPLSYLTWRRTIKALRELDPEAAARFEHAVIGRGKVSYEASSRYMNADQFGPDSPNLRAAVRLAETLRDTKGIAAFPAAWKMWTHFVFEFLNNRMVERPTQRLQAGKAIRDSGLLGRGILNLGEEAIGQAARGLTETKQQTAFANALRDSFGAYRALPPWQKKWISTYTPFVAWWLNSARFVGLVLPRDHPVMLALTAQAIQVVDDVDRQKSRPGWLRGTMVGNGIQWNVTRNIPFGAFTDPEKTFAGLFLPQVMPIIAAMAYGIDWKGKPLRNPDGSEYDTGQLLWYSAKQIAGSSIPAYAVPDRVIKYYNDPGVLLNALRVRTPSDTSKDAEPRPKASKRAAPAPPPAPSAETEEMWSDEDLGGGEEVQEDFWTEEDLR